MDAEVPDKINMDDLYSQRKITEEHKLKIYKKVLKAHPSHVSTLINLGVVFEKKKNFKASIECENENFSRLGSVVTNLGYSDWATTDIDTISGIWYRLSRRGSDFLVESSFDGVSFKQMRIFHLHKLGETTEQMGKSNPPLVGP